MSKNINLLEGNITSSIAKLAFPLMGMSLLQMAYNLTDIFWIGKLGAGAVAAVGTGGLLAWLSMGIHMLAQIGGQVLVAQNLGAKDYKSAGKFAHSAIVLSATISISIGIIYNVFLEPIIGFFNLNDAEVIAFAKTYVSVICGFIFFQLMAKLLTSLITTTGNSKTPFIASTFGLIFNMIIDPILIFGLLGFPELGVLGAAIATVLAQIIVLVILVLYTKRDKVLFCHVKLLSKPDFSYCTRILRLSLPVSIQNTIFPLITMYLSRLVAGFGDHAVAAQRIGSQIESISWMASDGFAIAVSSFIAQNYGAKNLKRAHQGFIQALKITLIYGVFTSCVLIFFAEPLFSIFLSDAPSLAIGIDYLVIMGFSQLFLCVEILCSNSLNALGKTMPAATISLSCMSLRVPLATILSASALGISGIWYSMLFTSMAKGTLMLCAILYFFHLIKKISQ